MPDAVNSSLDPECQTKRTAYDSLFMYLVYFFGSFPSCHLHLRVAETKFLQIPSEVKNNYVCHK